MNLDPPILEYYAEGREHDRLLRDPKGVLERLRTWDLFERVLPANGVVIDIGGGAGIHAGWLARRGIGLSYSIRYHCMSIRLLRPRNLCQLVGHSRLRQRTLVMSRALMGVRISCCFLVRSITSSKCLNGGLRCPKRCGC